MQCGYHFYAFVLNFPFVCVYLEGNGICWIPLVTVSFDNLLWSVSSGVRCLGHEAS